MKNRRRIEGKSEGEKQARTEDILELLGEYGPVLDELVNEIRCQDGTVGLFGRLYPGLTKET